MAATSIEWTDHSISPIRARSRETGKVFHFCERISPGCKLCYAATLAHRFGLPDYIRANRGKVEFFLDQDKLRSVLKRKRPTKFFWEDCSDLFGDWVPDEWIDQCFAVMAMTPQHTHQVLTKRPERMAAYLLDRSCEGDVLPREIWSWTGKVGGELLEPALKTGVGLWPLRNVWLGTSCEDQQRAEERIPWLRKCPAAVRFVSAEPLLGPITLSLLACGSCGGDKAKYHAGPDDTFECAHGVFGAPLIDWVIVGGESGHGARPMHPDWARSLRDQCQAAGVPYFFKQWGEFGPADHSWSCQADGETVMQQLSSLRMSRDLAFSGDNSDDDLWRHRNSIVVRVGKKAAGRLLDDREWSEFPATATERPA